MYSTHAGCSRYCDGIPNYPHTEWFNTDSIYFAHKSAICLGLNRNNPPWLHWASARAARMLRARLIRRLAGDGGCQPRPLLGLLAETPLGGPSMWLGLPRGMGAQVHFPKKGDRESFIASVTPPRGSHRGIQLPSRWCSQTASVCLEKINSIFRWGAPRF